MIGGRGAGPFLLSVLLLVAPAGAQEPEPSPEVPRFGDSAEVARVLIEARVLDPGGRPRQGLAPDDLRLRIDGALVPIESVHWIGEGTPEVHVAPTEPGDTSTPEVTVKAGGRLILLLFQVDLHASRSAGLVRLLREAEEMLARLEPGDRVAVATFATHLRLWQDFTTDRERVRRVLQRSVLFGEAVGHPDEGVLGPAFDDAAAREAASLEQALQVTAAALEDVTGSKSLLLFGGTMGHASAAGVWLEDAYNEARRSFAKSNTTVFALDPTDADAHTLDAGLQQVALDTGGFFARTRDFASGAIARVEGALAGHYLVAFARPEGPRGWHDVKLELVDRRGEVLSAPGYVD